MEYAVFLAIWVGLASGALLGVRWSKAVALKLSAGSGSPRLIVLLAWVGGVISLLPAFFISFVVGGTLGGGYGEAATTSLGLGSIGVPFGLTLGIAAILSIGVAAGTSIGALVGTVISYALSP